MSSTPRNPKAKKADAKINNAPSRRAELQRQRELEAQQARRKKIMLILTGVLVAALVIGLATWGIIQATKPKMLPAEKVPAAQFITADQTGINPAPGVQAKADAPTVEVISDFQCPACKGLETNFGAKFVELAKSGDIKLEFRPVTFLDNNLRNDASVRATRMAMCTVQTGKFADYYATVFRNQPAEEGPGYTDAQLTGDFLTQAGITGPDAATVKKCYADGKFNEYVSFADERNQKHMADAGSNGTPTILVNGKQLKQDPLYTVETVNGKQQGVPHPEKLLEVIKNTK